MKRRDFLRGSGACAAAAILPIPALRPRAMTIALTPGSIGVSAKSQLELNALAARHGLQIRRLDYKRDSLQDIFLRAMEPKAEEVDRGGV